MIRVTLLLLVLAYMACKVRGHGRLRSPPGRSSMWRDGFHVPTNYQDNELNCGGSQVHWEVNKGKCGPCGDRYDAAIQENQPPYGKYARPVLADCYSMNDRYIDTFVEITANHFGYVEFRLCPNNDFYSPVTEECLNRNVLNIIDDKGKNHGRRFKVKEGHKNLFLKAEIPKGMTCSQCVLQWRYVSGNNWGCDYFKGRRRACGIGRGGQESFFNCADIAILDNCKGKVTRRGVIDREAENRAKAKGLRPRFVFDDEDLNPSGIIGRKIEREKKDSKKISTKKPETDVGPETGQKKTESQNNPTKKPQDDVGRVIKKKEESQNNLTKKPQDDVGRPTEKEDSQNNPTKKPQDDVGRPTEKEDSQNNPTKKPQDDVGRPTEKEDSQNNPTKKPQDDVGRPTEKEESQNNLTKKPQDDVGRPTEKEDSQNNPTKKPQEDVVDSSETKASDSGSTSSVDTQSKDNTQKKQTSPPSQSQKSKQKDGTNSESSEESGKSEQADESETKPQHLPPRRPPPPPVPTSKTCRPIGLWTRFPSMVFWCVTNCAVDFCPSFLCKCT